MPRKSESTIPHSTGGALVPKTIPAAQMSLTGYHPSSSADSTAGGPRCNMNAQPPTTLAPRPGESADLLAAAEHLLPQIKRLPELSQVVNDFLTLSRKQYLTAREFEEVISRDRDLHAWLIRQANSGFFNPARPIHTIADASVIIGLDALQRMVHAVCSRDLLRYRMRCYHLPGNGSGCIRSRWLLPAGAWPLSATTVP